MSCGWGRGKMPPLCVWSSNTECWVECHGQGASFFFIFCVQLSSSLSSWELGDQSSRSAILPLSTGDIATLCNAFSLGCGRSIFPSIQCYLIKSIKSEWMQPQQSLISHWVCQPQGFRNWTSRCPSICVPKLWSTEWKISNKLAASIAWSNKCMIKCNPKSFNFRRYAVRGICSSKRWICRVFTQDIKTRDCLFNSQKRICMAFPYFNKSTVRKPTKWWELAERCDLYPAFPRLTSKCNLLHVPHSALQGSQFPCHLRTGGTKNATTNHNHFGHAQHISESNKE